MDILEFTYEDEIHLNCYMKLKSIELIEKLEIF